MIEPVAIKLIWAAAILVAYGMFRWRWLVATQDFVVSAMQDAEQRRRSPESSAIFKDLVERFSNAVYHPFATWWIAVLVSCGVVVAVIWTVRRKNSARAQYDAADEDARMTSRLLVAVLTTSPIALVLVVVVFCLGFLFQGSAKAMLELIPEATVFGRLHQPST